MPWKTQTEGHLGPHLTPPDLMENTSFLYTVLPTSGTVYCHPQA